jgi:hypothetical protein
MDRFWWVGDLGIEFVGCFAPCDYGRKNKAEESTDEKTDYQGNHGFLLS